METEDGVIELEDGLGITLRVKGKNGGYVEWSIIADEQKGTGAFKVIGNTCRGKDAAGEKLPMRPRIAIIPEMNNSVTITPRK